MQLASFFPASHASFFCRFCIYLHSGFFFSGEYVTDMNARFQQCLALDTVQKNAVEVDKVYTFGHAFVYRISLQSYVGPSHAAACTGG